MSRPVRTTRRAVAAVFALGLLSPGAARAANDVPGPQADAVARAHAHFERGVQRYDEQDYRSALIEFERAYTEAPARSVLLDIGQARYQLLDYAGALTALERYVADAPAGAADPRRALVDREIAELTARVGHLELRGEIDDAELVLDDVPIAAAHLPATIRVNAGRRRILLRKGALSVVRVVDVAAGETIPVALLLAPAAREAPHVAPDPVLPTARGLTLPALTYSALGVGAAGAIVGATFGALALDRRSSLDRDCVSGACAPARADDIDALRRDATLSTVAFAAGAAGLGVALITLLIHPRSSDAGTRATVVHAWVDPRSIGVGGRF